MFYLFLFSILLIISRVAQSGAILCSGKEFVSWIF